MAWSEETKAKARKTRARNRKLRQIGELVLQYPLFWKYEGRNRGYGDLVDEWDGQFKRRKKKPRHGSNVEMPARLYRTCAVTKELLGIEKQESRSIRELPVHFLLADYCVFIASSRMGNVKLAKVDCSMMPTTEDYVRIYRQFTRKHPACNGYTMAGAAFLKFVVPDQLVMECTEVNNDE